MRELIDREAVIDLLKKMRKDGDMVPWEGKDVFARIRKLPTIQTEERTEKRTETHGVCLDAISRKPAIDALMAAIDDVGILDGDDIKVVFDNLPSAQPEPQEGHWIEGKIYRDVIECNCSECGQLMTTAATVRMNYCPNCGAKMRGEQHETD